jgi:hypothetical protein
VSGDVASADALDAALGRYGKTSFRNWCLLGSILHDASPEFRQRLEEHLATPKHQLQHSAIAKALTEVTGVVVKPDMVSRHRRRLCSCES